MSPRRRRFLSRLLAATAVLSLVASTTALYAKHVLFDSRAFANRAVSVLEDEAVKERIADSIADAAIEKVPNAIAARPVIQSVASGLVGSPALQGLLADGINDVHRTVIEGDSDTLLVTLADVGTLVRQGVAAAAPQIAKKIPRTLDADVLTAGGGPDEAFLIDVSRLRTLLGVIGWGGLVLFALAGIGAIALAPTRLSGLRRMGRSLAIGGIVAIAAWLLGRALLTAGLEGATEDAVRAIWDAFLADLRIWFALVAGAGVVLTAGATSTREPVDIGAGVRRVWELIATVPERVSLRAARAAALILAGLLLISNRDEALDLAVLLVGAYVVYVGAAELMRIAAGGVRAADAGASPAEQAEADLSAGPLARVLTVGVLLLGAIVGLGLVANDPERPPLQVDTCNGYLSLCDKRLDEVVFAGTHNSMSGATYDKWFFAQQEAGIRQQLEAGYRALLLDPHYGVKTPKGVATDLEHDFGSRQKIEESLGPEAIAAAERLRAQIGYDGGGDRQVYLCHGFCELGAIEAPRAFRELADFLAANPGEVVVMSIEDATSPEDTVAALKAGGLTDYVYRGTTDPFPTLREMIDSNQRLFVMAERDGGQPPWYRAQFDITQETPYKFERPEQLEKPDSCRPNRGPGDAPLLLLNHWVDTSPAPRPTNARVVNRKQFILDRAAMCEEVRGQPPSIVAVDFFKEGDPVGAVADLNGLGAPTETDQP